jgi:hypothetical protein
LKQIAVQKQQPIDNVNTKPVLKVIAPNNSTNISASDISSVNTTSTSSNNELTVRTDEKENNTTASGAKTPAALSPPPTLTINMQAPFIPCLTPPTPPGQATSAGSSETVNPSVAKSLPMDREPSADHDENSQSSAVSSGDDDSASNYSSASEGSKRKLPLADENSSTEQNNDNSTKKNKAEDESMEEEMEDAETAKSDGNENQNASIASASAETIAPPPASPQRPIVVENVGAPPQAQNTAPVVVEAKPEPEKIAIVNSAVVQPPLSATPPPRPPSSVQQPQIIIQQQQPTANVAVENAGGNYLCEWNMCNRYFVSAKAVYNHVCKQHLLNNTSSDAAGCLCLWTGCDQIKRQKWSLVNHIQVYFQ